MTLKEQISEASTRLTEARDILHHARAALLVAEALVEHETHELQRLLAERGEQRTPCPTCDGSGASPTGRRPDEGGAARTPCYACGGSGEAK